LAKRLAQTLFRVFQVLLAGLAIVAGFSITPFVMAHYEHIGWLAYPTYFGLYMLLNGLVLAFLLPARKRKDAAVPLLQKWLHISDERFSRGFWMKLKGKGAFALVLVAALLFSPLFATVVIRFLGIQEQKAWFYSFVTTLLATFPWVALYTTIWEAGKSLLA